jgi:hypothetical protein
LADFRDICTAALQEIGVLAAGETPSAADADLAFAVGNRMVDQWAAEKLQIHTITRTTFTISAVASYTVGTGATINVPRPVSMAYINEVRLIDTTPNPDMETPLQPLTDDGYAALPQKALTATRPYSWWYNPTVPTGTLYLFPIPTDSGLQGAIYAQQAVQRFASLSTAVALPPGYEEMLVSNLAVRLAAIFEREVHPSLARKAAESQATVKRSNRRITDLSFPSDALIGGGGAWSIYTGP